MEADLTSERVTNMNADTAEGEGEVGGLERAWCHGCAKEVTSFYNGDLELECETCHSTFVEKHGQTGLSEYITAETSSSSATIETGESSSRPEQAEAASSTSGTTGATASEAEATSNPLSLIPASPFSEEENSIIRRILESSDSPPAGSRTRGGDRMNIMNIRQRAAAVAPDAFNAEAMILSILSSLNGVGELQQGLQIGGGSGVPHDALADILHHILVHETSVPGAPPASEDDISSIKKVEVTEDNLEDLGGSCYISQEPFVVGDTVLRLNCGHAFNEEDITKWLKMHNTCPVCRESVNRVDGSGNQKEDAGGTAAGVPRVDDESSASPSPPPLESSVQESEGSS